MSKLSELFKGVELSDEQRQGLADIEAEQVASAAKAKKDAEAAKEAAATTYLSEMDTMGLGEKDTPGLRVKVRDYFISDDGEFAIELSETTTSGKRTAGVGMTATEIVKDIIGALPRTAEGKVALSQQARALPGDPKPPEGEKPEGEAEEDKRTGKERADALLGENPGFAGAIGVPVPAVTGGGS